MVRDGTEVFRSSDNVPKLPQAPSPALMSLDKLKRLDVCNSLFNRRRMVAWIDSVVNIDEKYRVLQCAISSGLNSFAFRNHSRNVLIRTRNCLPAGR